MDPLPQLQQATVPQSNPLPFAEPPTPSSGYTSRPLELGQAPKSFDVAPQPQGGYTAKPLELGAPLPAAGAAATGIGAVGTAALAVGAAAVGLATGEAIRQGGLALEESGAIPDTPIFEPYPWEASGPPPMDGAVVPGSTPAFSGGQSYGVPYRLRYKYTQIAPYQGTPFYVFNNVPATSVLPGPIRGVGTGISSGIPAYGFYYGVIPAFAAVMTLDLMATNYFLSDLVIERLDGEPDTGGDPDPEPKRYAPPVPQGARGPSPSDPGGQPADLPGLPDASQPKSPRADQRLAPPVTQPTAPPADQPLPDPGEAPSPDTQPDQRIPVLPGLPSLSQPAPSQGEDPDLPLTQPGLSRQSSPLPSPLPEPSKEKAPGLAPPNFDPCGLNPCHGGGEPSTGADSALLQKIAQTVGVGEFPGTLPLLNGKGVVPIANLPQLVRWQVQAFDSVYGQFPLSVQVFQADGSTKTIKLENLAHSIDELFGMLLAVAEDADAAVNIGARNIVETIQAKIAAKQAGELATANQKFLGYNIKAVPREVKISVTPAAAGADNKLQNQEMTAFLEPSKQQYIGSEYDDSKQLLPIAERTLEDGEIARAALFRPVKVSKDKTGDVGLTGEFIRSSRGNDEILNKAWLAFLEQLKKEGYEVDGNKSQSK
jgi:hypothetical protein